MPLLAFIIFFASAADLGLGLYPLIVGKRRKLVRLFSLMCFVIAYWTITNPLMTVSPFSFWVKNSYAAGILVPPVVLIWVMELLNLKVSTKQYFLIVLPAVLIFFATYIDGFIIKHIDSVSIGGFEGRFGPLFIIFAAYSLISIAAIFFLLFRGLRNARGIFKLQIKYVTLGLVGFGIVVSAVSYILPLLGVDNLIPLDSPSSLLFIVAISFAVFRHRLLDVRFLLTRSIIYGFLLTLVALSFVLITFISAQFFGDIPSSRYTASFTAAAVIVFGLDPFKRLLSRISDRFFYKAKIDYQTSLRSLTEIISTEIDIDNLIERLATNLATQLKIKKAILILRSEPKVGERELYHVRSFNYPNTPPVEIDGESPLIKFMKQHQHSSVLEALERRIEDTRDETQRKELEYSRAEFEKLGAAVVAPIEAQGQLNAILALGPKLSGDSYSNDDLNLIAVLGPQIGSAIEKGKLYERVKEFSESLQEKVTEATSELQERNVSLVTLQNITKEITRTLDFNRVAQKIANSISTELGYLGAILVLLDDDGHTSRARAVTETPLTRRVMKLIPKHFSEYPSDLNDPKYQNMEAKALRTGMMQVSDHISDIVCPPLPKVLANTMQKMLGVKTIFVVPVVSEDKVMGVIEVGTKRERSTVKEAEVGTLQSVADQLGVVARNIKLFEQIRSTNEKLAEANRHLQALDQAKSEFVSIASHQLRTPMTGIMGYLSMMVGGDFGSMKPEHAKILKELLAESQRMIRLINLFLNVSKIEAGKFTVDMEPASLEAIIEHEVGELTKEAQDKGLKLAFKRPAKPLPSINVDADKLQDVLLNLIDNAVKYTATGSITVSVHEEQDGLTVAVKDTGIGIDPMEARELFNKFVRGSGIAQIHPDGSGLGLFIAKRIVEAHGGRIWVESAGRGKGSTFQFFLPKSGPQGRFEVGEESVTARPPLPANVAH